MPYPIVNGIAPCVPCLPPNKLPSKKKSAIVTVCCPGGLPSVLQLVLSLGDPNSDCANGQGCSLTWNGSAWIGTMNVVGCTGSPATITWRLQCFSSPSGCFGLILDVTAGCLFGFNSVNGPLSCTCSPLNLVYQVNWSAANTCWSGADGTIQATITG